MKKNLLFAAFLTVLVIFSLCFAAVKLPEPKLLGISIIGPDSVPADTQTSGTLSQILTTAQKQRLPLMRMLWFILISWQL
jgi:hypothetical protein